ncbi:MAG: hypothetical protein M1830_005167 [Pleopsidium flavum]|nr:MAG: hypothetical protein M1830_005167 [Pleopsidium flavum]
MKSSFAARRKARRIGTEEDEEDVGLKGQSSGESSNEPESTPVVKRAILTSTGSSKPKKKSSLRLSFGPGETSMTADAGDSSEVFTPKKSNLSRQAIEKNALRKTLASSLSSEHLPIRSGQSDDRPSYSKDYLNELRSSTPSTPKDLASLSADEDEIGTALDIAAKFGTALVSQDDGMIPTEAAIKEKKERRARLAKEQEFISLDDDDVGNEISLLPRKEKKATRLVREDEDLGEGFDEFVEDGRISLGKKAEREQKRRHRVAMQDMINEAEGSSDEDSDDSEAQRKGAYEAAQTRAGMDGLHKDHHQRPTRPRTPPRITPLPSLSSCLERLQSALSTLEYNKMQNVKKMEDIQHQKAQIAVREVEIQQLLKTTGATYEKLRAEAGLGGGLNGSLLQNGKLSNHVIVDRGLESFGDTPIRNVEQS